MGGLLFYRKLEVANFQQRGEGFKEDMFFESGPKTEFSSL